MMTMKKKMIMMMVVMIMMKIMRKMMMRIMRKMMMREMEMYDAEIGKIRDKNLLVPIENQMSGRMIEIENPSGGDVKLDAFIFTMNRNQFG